MKENIETQQKRAGASAPVETETTVKNHHQLQVQ